ncbi:hypothetical protein Tco_0782265 [Tanacetum coccineum]
MAKNLTSPVFILNRSEIPNLYPHADLFVNHLRSLFECDFVSLDSRLYSRKSIIDDSFGSAEEVDHVRILQSCNGLLICVVGSVVLRMAFDPRKSFDYKMVQAGRTSCDIKIQIYSSDMGIWSLCRDRFNYFSCDHFDSAIY